MENRDFLRTAERERTREIVREAAALAQAVHDRRMRFWFIWLPLELVGFLVALYGLTKFIKWAWYN